MIAFGSAITDARVFERFAEPGIKLAAEPDSVVLANGSAGSLFRSYNLVLDQAKKLDGLEALVLVHQDAELTDPDFCDRIRKELEDPDVAIVGAGGAIGWATGTAFGISTATGIAAASVGFGVARGVSMTSG